MPKTIRSFGLMQDGFSIKIAHLEAEKDEIRIKGLQTVKLPEVEPVEAAPDTMFDDTLSGMDFDFDFTEETGPEPEVPEENSQLPDMPEEVPEKPEERTLESAAREFDFEHGTLSLNLDISNVTYKETKIDQKAGKKKVRSELRKLFFDEQTPAVMTLSHLRRSDGSLVGIGHEGKMQLLENLINLNRSLSKKRYHYSYIQPNEIALINALRFNYAIKSEDITAIIYLGVDSSRVTLVKGYDFLAELPIINEGYQKKDVIKTVFSRLRLEASHQNISQIDNYFLAGDGLQDSMLEYIAQQQPEARTEYLLPQKLTEMTDYSGIYDDQTLAAYIIPIMLAVTAALPKDPGFIRTNFLPKQLKEQQNIFSISATGFAVLGLILLVSLFSINNILQRRTENRSIELELEMSRSQLEVTRDRLAVIEEIRQEIAKIETNIARSNLLISDKNQWHFIMERISNSFHRNRISWLISLRREQDGFRITGNTTNRLNIITLSKLFPEARIQTIDESQIEEHTIWDFDIRYVMPDPLETKRINYLRESQISNYGLPNHFNRSSREIITDRQDDSSQTEEIEGDDQPFLSEEDKKDTTAQR